MTILLENESETTNENPSTQTNKQKKTQFKEV